MRASVRPYDSWPEAIWPELKSFHFLAPLDLDVTTDSPLTRLAMATVTTKVSCFKRKAGQNYIEVHLLMPWPGERKRATFWSRCCPRVVSTRRRFYSKGICSGALASEAARLLTSFSTGWLTKSRDQPGCARALWLHTLCVYVHARAY